MGLANSNLWRPLNIFQLCQMKCYFGLFMRVAESILTVRWGTVGMQRKFLRRAALRADSLGLIVTQWPSKPVEKGSHDSVIAWSFCTVILLT